jgi:hypothetical protein
MVRKKFLNIIAAMGAVIVICAVGTVSSGAAVAVVTVNATTGQQATSSTMVIDRHHSSAHPYGKVGYQKTPVDKNALRVLRAALAKNGPSSNGLSSRRAHSSYFCGVGNTSPIAWIAGTTPLCITVPITINWTQNGQVLYLANSSGARVWFHQNANSTGWADCFNHGMFYATANSRDQYPGNIQVTNVHTQCPGGGADGRICNAPGPFAGYITSELGGICYQGPGTYNTQGLTTIAISNGTGNRVWIHQNPNSSGWSDCLSNNNAYANFASYENNPGNLQITTTPSLCPGD